MRGTFCSQEVDTLPRPRFSVLSLKQMRQTADTCSQVSVQLSSCLHLSLVSHRCGERLVNAVRFHWSLQFGCSPLPTCPGLRLVSSSTPPLLLLSWEPQVSLVSGSGLNGTNLYEVGDVQEFGHPQIESLEHAVLFGEHPRSLQLFWFLSCSQANNSRTVSTLQFQATHLLKATWTNRFTTQFLTSCDGMDLASPYLTVVTMRHSTAVPTWAPSEVRSTANIGTPLMNGWPNKTSITMASQTNLDAMKKTVYGSANQVSVK